MALHGQTPGKIRAAVRELKPFKFGNVSGDIKLTGTGRLPEEYAAELREHDRNGYIKYVLYSYGTPMAWLVGAVWIKPPVKYSVSTSGHQSVFADAIGQRTLAA